jgi:prepilin-type N-terminal cleavage/methylation domain-containing protein
VSQLHRQRRSQGGFTLIELLVSLVAGLIVAMAVVALAKDATATFHEEARTSSAETSLRLGVERLRADLQRAAFMGTGNITKDTYVPLDPTQSRVTTAVLGHASLAGIRFLYKGSLAATPLSGINGYAPDAIDITGNLTSSDQYVVSSVDSGGSLCGGQRLRISFDSAATYRILASSQPDLTFERMFQPVPNKQFLVRIADDLGRSEYFLTCATTKSAGWNAAGSYAYVDLAPSPVLDVTRYGFVDGRLTVNPIATVRWEVKPVTSGAYAALANDGGVATGGGKYDLVRSYVDITTNEPFADSVIAPELIAEYAVDLGFAFSADTGNYVASPPVPNLVTYAFGDSANDTLAANVTVGSPQRIRSIRVRVSTRAAIPDRSVNLKVADNTYTIRYCVITGGCDDTKVEARQYARVRTMTTEVSTPNLSRGIY